ncbi:YceI family protein [Niallia taxi]|uniref:YceI family protein n=1 Tax=Niallia taxi TaxID=2499688 RepID=UPI0039826E31
MKKKYIISIAAVAVLILGIGGYTLLNSFMGNNVEINSVLDQNEESSTSEPSADSDATPVSAEDLNGDWQIADASSVYWSVTTSQETVNFVNEEVTGNWTVDINDPTAMSGEGIVDMNALDSGNSQRDDHVKEGAEYLNVTEFPEATFATSTFSELPTSWTEGTVVPVTIDGTITIKGIEKDVQFESEAMYQNGQLLLSGSTVVTFADFGMENPHSVALDTENDLTVQLELVLDKA